MVEVTTMSKTVSPVPNHVTNRCVRICQRYEAASPNWFPLATSLPIRKFQLAGNQMLQTYTSNLELRHSNKKRDMGVYGVIESGSTIISDPSPGSWNFWILGIIVTVILPFTKSKWGPLLKIKEKFDSSLQTAEQVTEVVEEVAEEVEKVAEEVADKLPAEGAFKEAVLFVEVVAKETVKDAKLADDVLERVEKMEKEVVSAVESDIDKASWIAKEAKA
ncbi:hypothetical protein K2173_027406 [Erythroxylum novogranatense]|uniref:Uncharacterized protein n=1 Tax=Erythroxylum novogranatense TaxID=1862640 RepID=A0AAV8U271_9ROSI|nr:hypothetical protein K2173_027406 [Erythroxylum novogranatense]